MSLYDTKEEKLKRREKQQRVAESKQERLMARAGECFATDAGRFMLNHIMKECAFNETSVVVSAATAEINPMSTIFNEGRRSVYLSLRNLLKEKNQKLLMEIELLKQN